MLSHLQVATMLTIINILAWLLLLGLPFIGFRRGSGPMLCIGIYVLLFSLLIAVVSPSLGASMPVVPTLDVTVNTGWWQIVMFIPLLGLSFPLGLNLNRFLAYTIEPFEEVVGMAIGLVVAVIALRTFLGGVSLCTSGTDLQASIDQLFLVRQVVELDGYHGVQSWFTNLHKATEL